MYDTILLPTDGSNAATATADHAIELAEHTGARVVVVSVVDTRVSTAVGDDTRADVLDSLQRDAERAVDRVAERLEAAGIDHETDVQRAHPHRGILFSAEEHDVDLIVMGTRGRQGDARGPGMGSVTQRVLDSERWPVLVINVGD